MRKALSVHPLDQRDEAPKLRKKGCGWNVAESRLDTLHETARELCRVPTEALADVDAVTARIVAELKGRWQEQRARPAAHRQTRGGYER